MEYSRVDLYCGADMIDWQSHWTCKTVNYTSSVPAIAFIEEEVAKR